jgi:hypothetical protein
MFGFRSRLGSRYTRRRALAIVITLLVGWQVMALNQSARAQRDRWESGPRVWVTTRSIDAGATIGPDDVDQIAVPKTLAPSDATENPVGQSTRVALPANVVVGSHVLAAADPSSDASALDIARVAIRVPLTTTPPNVVAGDRVSLWAAMALSPTPTPSNFDVDFGGSVTETAALGAPVVNQAIVISRTDEDITVSIGQGDAPMLVGAMATSSLVALALAPENLADQ